MRHIGATAIARATGIHRSTVHRYLRGDPIQVGTRQAIDAAIQRLAAEAEAPAPKEEEPRG